MSDIVISIYPSLSSYSTSSTTGNTRSSRSSGVSKIHYSPSPVPVEYRADLTADIQLNVRSFFAKTGIKPENNVTGSQCWFRSFEADMRPMTDSVEAEIRAKFRWRTRKIQSAEELLKQVDDVISAIKQNDIQP